MSRKTRRVKKDRRKLAKRIAAPVTCDLVCPRCNHHWTQDLIPAAHVFLSCPACSARLGISARPPVGVSHTQFTSR